LGYDLLVFPVTYGCRKKGLNLRLAPFAFLQGNTGAHDAARICLPCLTMTGMPGSAGECSRCLVPADGRRQPRRGTRVSLTTECLRPCLAERGIATLSVCSRQSWLDTRATSRRRTRQIIRSVMSVNSTLPRLACMRNARSGVVTSCSSVAPGMRPIFPCTPVSRALRWRRNTCTGEISPSW